MRDCYTDANKANKAHLVFALSFKWNSMGFICLRRVSNGVSFITLITTSLEPSETLSGPELVCFILSLPHGVHFLGGKV
jgi:hypothetical protein